jgi:hypothetical protein
MRTLRLHPEYIKNIQFYHTMLRWIWFCIFVHCHRYEYLDFYLYISNMENISFPFIYKILRVVVFYLICCVISCMVIFCCPACCLSGPQFGSHGMYTFALFLLVCFFTNTMFYPYSTLKVGEIQTNLKIIDRIVSLIR